MPASRTRFADQGPRPRINVMTEADRNNVLVYINTLPQRALVDTGAKYTVISQQLYERIKSGRAKPVKYRQFDLDLNAANNTAVKIIGSAEVKFRIAGLVIPFEVKIVQRLSQDVILGMDFLHATGAHINLRSKTLEMYDGLAVASMISIGDYTAQAIRTVSIPPLSEAVFPIKAKGLPRQGNFVLEGGAFPCAALMVARTLVRPGRRMCCRVMNPTDAPIIVKVDAPVGYLSAVTDVQRTISVPPLDDKPLPT